MGWPALAMHYQLLGGGRPCLHVGPACNISCCPPQDLVTEAGYGSEVDGLKEIYSGCLHAVGECCVQTHASLKQRHQQQVCAFPVAGFPLLTCLKLS